MSQEDSSRATLAQDDESVAPSNTAVISKILHDLASPLTVLNFLSETHPDIKDAVDDMTWRFKCFRHIFVSTSIPAHEAQDLSRHIKINLEGDEYNKIFVLLGFIFRNTPMNLKIKHHKLELSKADIKKDDEILMRVLKEELKRFNITLLMI
ncbi:MAG: hypothetical protein H6850_01450 [Alphaproteobacteria bacterium]|nr:MAG: hypothetical protein H6850_01450 [Alphaproteobacteria bacterium]